jgi:hypothetical protein
MSQVDCGKTNKNGGKREEGRGREGPRKHSLLNLTETVLGKEGGRERCSTFLGGEGRGLVDGESEGKVGEGR